MATRKTRTTAAMRARKRPATQLELHTIAFQDGEGFASAAWVQILGALVDTFDFHLPEDDRRAAARRACAWIEDSARRYVNWVGPERAPRAGGGA